MQKITKQDVEELCDGDKQLTKAELKELIKLLDVLEQDFYHEYRHINGGFAEVQMYNYDDDQIDIQVESGEQDMGSGHSSCYTDLVTLPREVLLDKKMSFEEKCKSFQY